MHTAGGKRLTGRQAFSAARNEHTTLRVEQTLVVNNVENQVRLRRLEEMMSRVLLNTPFGQGAATRTMDLFSSVRNAVFFLLSA
jgi:hypothetical protein